MKELVSVLIPITDPNLTEFEKSLLDHCVKALGKYSLIFVASEKADLSYLKEHYRQVDTVCFNEKYFQTDRSIDSLLLMDGFYDRFNWCEFVLIHRLNSWIVKDELHYWCKQGYDLLNGNLMGQLTFWQELLRIRGYSKSKIIEFDQGMVASGISLRHVERCVKILKRKRQVAYDYRHHNELVNIDALFWDLETNRFFPDLRRPTPIVSSRFSGVAGAMQPIKSDDREQWPFALSGVTPQNKMKLPYFD